MPRAEPARIIILRHGEKQDAYRLCDVGVQRSLALTTRYLGRGAEASIYGSRGAPDAFFAITLHTLELIGPTASSWRMPVIMNSVLPGPKQDAAEFTHMLNLRTQEAVADVMTNWSGKTVVMAWEHHHIADEKLALAFPRLKVTLRQLLNLDSLGTVPKTWPGSNYDYFWIIDYEAGRPKNFEMVKQTFARALSGRTVERLGHANGAAEGLRRRQGPNVIAACFRAHRTARQSYRWHTGQKNVERPVCTIRRMTPLQPAVGHGSPSRS